MNESLPNIDLEHLDLPSLDKLNLPSDPAHKPRILLLYGSNRECSFSRLMSQEAARLLEAMGCETRIFDPAGLPLPDDAPESHPKVKELRELVIWSEGQVWCSPERHGAMSAVFKAQIDWVPLSMGAVRPTQGKTLALMQVCGGSQSFNAVNQMRVLGRWMRMVTIPNQSSVPKAFLEFDDAGRMKPSAYYDRVVDVMEEQPLKHLTSIVSLKKAASKLHRRTRYYAIKRLAVEAIANLLIEKENQSAFVELSGVNLFRNLIRTNEVFYQEQKRICVALFHLSKNEKMRKLLYEKGLMLILRDVVDEGTTDLIVSVLRALRNCAGPIFRDEGLPKAAKMEMAARQTLQILVGLHFLFAKEANLKLLVLRLLPLLANLLLNPVSSLHLGQGGSYCCCACPATLSRSPLHLRQGG